MLFEDEQAELGMKYYEHLEKYWVEQAMIAKDEERRRYCYSMAEYCAAKILTQL